MIRVIIENIVLFFLPAAIYVAYIYLTRSDPRKGLLDGAPVIWLVVAGTALVVVVLVVADKKPSSSLAAAAKKHLT